MNQKTIGFDTKVESIGKSFEKTSFKDANTQDLIKFGIIPEFIGRFPVIAALSELSEKELVKVMSETKNSISDQYKYLFKMDGIELEFNKEAYVAIAQEARASASGAEQLDQYLKIFYRTQCLIFLLNKMLSVINKKAVKTKKLPLDCLIEKLLINENRKY